MNQWFSTWFVAELRAKAAGERKLAALRQLGRKIVNKRLPSSFQNSEGHQVEDQSRWGEILAVSREGSGSGECARRSRAVVLRGELSLEKLQEAMKLVKPNVATGRDNVPGTILHFLPETTQILLINAVVERLAGREDAHVKGWAETDICLVPKKGDISMLSNWRPISLFPLCTNCTSSACGRCWTRNSDRSQISCLG